MYLLLAGDLSLPALIGRVPGGVSQGLIWGIMALGVFLTFRVLDIADLSVDGSFATGGAVATMLIIGGHPAWLAMLIAFACGLAAGLVTGLLHAKLGVPAILAGILTQFALYTVNLWIMGMANQSINPEQFSLLLSMRNIPRAILVGAIFAVVLIVILYCYFGTEHGSALRATGTNPAMSTALGINISTMKIVGLAISNGIVALAGGLMAQYQGFSDINMGRGAIVIGLAAIIIGEAICDAIFRKGTHMWVRMGFVVIGGILYYLAMTVVLWLKADPNDLKLYTAVIVTLFLVIPYIIFKIKHSFFRAGKRSLSYAETILKSLKSGKEAQ